MPSLHPYRMNPKNWERHMTHRGCGKCMRAARLAKTDTIVDDVDEATRTVDNDHTATVFRREGF